MYYLVYMQLLKYYIKVVSDCASGDEEDCNNLDSLRMSLAREEEEDFIIFTNSHSPCCFFK